MSYWQPIETAPRDRYILLFSPDGPRWDGNMEVGKWAGDDDGCFWSCGGPNGGLELGDVTSGSHHGNRFTYWMDLPADPITFSKPLPASQGPEMTSEQVAGMKARVP